MNINKYIMLIIYLVSGCIHFFVTYNFVAVATRQIRITSGSYYLFILISYQNVKVVYLESFIMLIYN